MTDPVIKTIDVACSSDVAFDIFTVQISNWWPLDGHAASAAAGKSALAVTIEPYVGGAVYETMHDNTRDEWGEVLVYEHGKKLLMSWHPGSNKSNPTRVQVTFEDIPNGGCSVTLTHSGWSVWADKSDEMRENYNGGWNVVFGDRYMAACKNLASG